MSSIENVEIQLFNVPLDEVLTDAKHGDHTHFELITVTIKLADGKEGTGYTYTGEWAAERLRPCLDTILHLS